MKAKNELWEKFLANLHNEGVTKSRVNKLKQMFNTSSRGLKVPYSKATRDDIEDLVNRLHTDQFVKQDGKPFSGSTKSDIKKFLKQFFKWYKGDNEFYPKEVSWIKTRISKDEQPKEKPVLSIFEVEKVASAFKKIEFKTLTLCLFDSGFRIDELLSTRKKDITWEIFEGQQKCFWIKCNKSKTEVRKVPIPLFTEDLKTFFNSLYFKELKNDDKAFQISYVSYLIRLGKSSMKVLGKKITPHALRHSSATYYAKEFDGNMMLLADRYGWTYSSKELRTYIRRSGAYQRAGAKKVFSNEVEKLREENRNVKETLRAMEEKMEKMQENIAKEMFEKLAEKFPKRDLVKA